MNVIDLCRIDIVTFSIYNTTNVFRYKIPIIINNYNYIMQLNYYESTLILSQNYDKSFLIHPI